LVNKPRVAPTSRWPHPPLASLPQLFPYATVNGLTLGVGVDDRPPADSGAGGPHYGRFILDENAGVLIFIAQSAIAPDSFCFAVVASGGSARRGAVAVCPAAESLLYFGGPDAAPGGALTVHAWTDLHPVDWAPAPEARVVPSRAARTSPLDFAGFVTAARRLLGDAVGRPGGGGEAAAAASDGGGPAAAATAAAAAGWPSAPRPWPAHATVLRRLLPVAAGNRLRDALVSAAVTAPGVAGRSWTAAVPTPAAAAWAGGGDAPRDGCGGARAVCMAAGVEQRPAPSAAPVVYAVVPTGTAAAAAAATAAAAKTGGQRRRPPVGRADVTARGAIAGRARPRHPAAVVHANDAAQVRRLATVEAAADAAALVAAAAVAAAVEAAQAAAAAAVAAPSSSAAAARAADSGSRGGDAGGGGCSGYCCPSAGGERRGR